MKGGNNNMVRENFIIKEFVDMFNRYYATDDLNVFYKMIGYCHGCYLSRQIDLYYIWDILKAEVEAVAEKYESVK